MRSLGALPAERRAAVERLLVETDLSIEAISARTGVNPRTVYTWNARSGWLRPPRWRRDLAARWTETRRAAVARLLSEPRNDPGDVAEASGVGRAVAVQLVAACGATPPGPSPDAAEAAADPALLDPASAADAPTLRAHLRAHIARQIAAFDAALNGEGAAVLDSARVLRDLGGLKRLLDEVAPASGGNAGEGGDGGTARDLPALRAEIARRYAGFVGGRDAA
ncbi:hypothetical protein [Methylobacterium sp. NEAU K]|uniref:hypothetical protein n=1 Tax=Methylobacterium sp. NEAU K TaxID=3064946 RepID=UPI002735B966|nr:hypothetical protein [Methylobacterium sp. NEAU K]MDP4004817.1 hypothetical protein [Methylobacterium sp. NEAU K]